MDDFLYGTRDFFLSVSKLADSACPNCSDCPLVLSMENKGNDLFVESILGSFKYRLCGYACGCCDWDLLQTRKYSIRNNLSCYIYAS